MVPMILALLIAVAAGGTGTYAMPNPLPGDTAYLPETRQTRLMARQMAQETALDLAPGSAKAAEQDTGQADFEGLATTTGPSAALPLVPAESPRVSPVLSSTIAVTLTQTISDVLKLADDALTPGQSYRGLLAKLEAAEKALHRGQDQAANHILDAFHNQLNAFQRSGHITAQNYDDLLSRYSALVASLGGVARERTEPNHGSESGASAAAAASPGHQGEGRKAGQPNARPPEDKAPKRRQ